MQEKNFQTLWHKYLETHPPRETEVHELKLCKQQAFPFNAVKDHQIAGLQLAQQGLFHKISDSPIFAGMKTRFTASKPFDCMWLTQVKPYVVICFYAPRQYKKVFKIPIDQFIELRNTWVRKSIRLEQLESQYEAINL